MKQEFLFGVAGLLLGFAAGYFLYAQPQEEMYVESTEHSEMADMEHGGMAHEMIEVDQTRPVPTVSIQAARDSKSGYNLRFVTENYTFTPEKSGDEPVQGEGHAHLYVNDVKVARVYGDWFHLDGVLLSEGANNVSITLNANDHSEWMVDGEHIGNEITLIK